MTPSFAWILCGYEDQVKPSLFLEPSSSLKMFGFLNPIRAVVDRADAIKPPCISINIEAN